ncbi:MAG: uracil-DNA glycosylase [Alphaproteobacteria bacterium]|nr:uracil-DNA glycosylase [Alphaproteobacteria bacterium]
MTAKEKNMFECPSFECVKCPRLVEFRAQNKQKFPTYHNAPVESFGALNAEILVVGLAPGLNGANQTNRPFTNDYAGDILYPALKKYGLARGNYGKVKNDGFELINVRVSNAVRCVPPQNKVTADEVKACRPYLQAEIAAMPNLKIILSLGAVSHGAVLQALGCKKSAYKFAHGAEHKLDKNGLILLDSYHTSRYNINTGVLTEQMFDAIVARLKELVKNA